MQAMREQQEWEERAIAREMERAIYSPQPPSWISGPPPYDIGGGKNVTVSGQVYRFEAWEPRADNS